jgi:hypothetical protein
MTRLSKKTPKVRYILTLTTANYDFLCVKAMRQGVTMARLLNEVIESNRNSDIKSCNGIRLSQIMREEKYV